MFPFIPLKYLRTGGATFFWSLWHLKHWDLAA
jgi:hypothetical protein